MTTTRTKSRTKAAPAADPVISAHDRYMVHNMVRHPVTVTEGKGCRLTDSAGRSYLDLFSGFGAGILGHCHEDLVAAATRQVNKLWHVGNLLHTEPQTHLARQIAEKGFGGISYFCHSGSDANEAAFKLARLYGQGKRHKVISTLGSFHGRGFAAMMATGQEKVRLGYEPWLAGFSHVPYNDLKAMEAAIDGQTVAIIVEPIQGEGGVNVPNAGYLPGLRKLCDKHDLLLIVDEVWTGCGRTGQWFAYQHTGITPDMMTLGKAVGCGLALGVMCCTPKLAELFDTAKQGVVRQATTLGGNCVTAAVSAAMFEVIERDGLVKRAAEAGEAIVSRLRGFADKYPVIEVVRGKGLFIGIQLNPKGAWFTKASEVVAKCMELGLMVGSAQEQVLRLAPPLTVSDDELDEGLNILEQALTGT